VLLSPLYLKLLKRVCEQTCTVFSALFSAMGSCHISFWWLVSFLHLCGLHIQSLCCHHQPWGGICLKTASQSWRSWLGGLNDVVKGLDGWLQLWYEYPFLASWSPALHVMACSKTMVMGRISQTLYHVTISIGLPRVSYRVPFFCFLGEISHPGDH
jgi:hypothetical protein